MCIFCKVVAGEIPSYKVYENDKVFAFLDIRPVHPGHTLIVPKSHCLNIEEATPEILFEIISAVKIIGKMIKEKLGVPGYNLVVNNDPASGQVVPHLHFHVVPRYDKDGSSHWKNREYENGEAEETLKKLLD